jgi:hypothetical protein
MRRLIATAMTAAFALALFLGPLATSATAPFVYGCGPAARSNASSAESRAVLYNGSAATANITLKLLASDGTNLSGLMVPAGSVFSIPATTTRWISWTYPLAAPTSPTVPISVRIVSDQSIAAGLFVQNGAIIVPCSYLHP